MRINNFDCPQLRRWIATGIASLTMAAPALGQSLTLAPTPMSAAISSVEAASWSGETLASHQTPLASDFDLAPIPADAPEAAAAGAPCESCGGGGGFPYNRCGCSNYALFPWFTGPGVCDNWCVGPHWDVAVDGLIMFRENTDWGSVPLNGFALDVADQFDNGPGARISVTGYNDSAFGMQVGYEGVNDFHANAFFSSGADARTVTYESNFNSVEFNFMRRTTRPLKPFAGVRYLQLNEGFVDLTTVDKPIPPPMNPPAAPAAFVDNGRSLFVQNRMIGLQGGAFRDTWRLNRWFSIEPFGNAGVYLNDFRRRSIQQTVTTVIRGDDLSTPGNEFSQVTTVEQTTVTREFTELGFVGEAGITGIWRLTPCVALRGGYQVLAINGVGTGLDAFLAPGLNATTLVYHGGHFGVEYVR
jgi:hypothetical protein